MLQLDIFVADLNVSSSVESRRWAEIQLKQELQLRKNSRAMSVFHDFISTPAQVSYVIENNIMILRWWMILKSLPTKSNTW